jgi:hypothetical protein
MEAGKLQFCLLKLDARGWRLVLEKGIWNLALDI